MDAAVHALRGPLGAILNFMEILREDLRGRVPREDEEILERVRQTCGLAQRLLEDLLELVRLRSGRVKQSRTRGDLAALVAGWVAARGGAGGDRDVALEMAEAAPLLVEMDEERVEGALAGVVELALQRAPRGSTVRVGLVAEPGAACVVVEDAGTRPRDEAIARAFEPFSEVQTPAEEGGSTGLGLSIAREVLEAHGGSALLEPAGEHGLRVVLRLPHC